MEASQASGNGRRVNGLCPAAGCRVGAGGSDESEGNEDEEERETRTGGRSHGRERELGKHIFYWKRAHASIHACVRFGSVRGDLR